MALKPLTNNDNLKIGTILKAARIRSGKTTDEIGIATGVSTRMVRFWERDIRGIGKGKGVKRTLEVFSAYGLTQSERAEIIKRISLRKQEYVENSLSTLLNNCGSVPVSDKSSEEMKVLIQLLALSEKAYQWVIQSANTHRALNNTKG